MSHNTVYMFKTVNPPPSIVLGGLLSRKRAQLSVSYSLALRPSKGRHTHKGCVCLHRNGNQRHSENCESMEINNDPFGSIISATIRQPFLNPRGFFLICMNVPNMHKKWNIFIYIMHHETKTEMRSATRKSNIHKEDKQEFCILLVVILKQ